MWKKQWTQIQIKKEDKKFIEDYRKERGLSGGVGKVAVHAIKELQLTHQALNKAFGKKLS